MKLTKESLKKMIVEEMESGIDKEMAQTIIELALRADDVIEQIIKGEVGTKMLVKDISDKYAKAYAENLLKDLLQPRQLEYTAKLLEKNIKNARK